MFKHSHVGSCCVPAHVLVPSPRPQARGRVSPGSVLGLGGDDEVREGRGGPQGSPRFQFGGTAKHLYVVWLCHLCSLPGLTAALPWGRIKNISYFVEVCVPISDSMSLHR